MYKKNIALIVVSIIFITYCSNPAKSDYENTIKLKKAPIITGIHETSIYQNGSTGQIFGHPSYPNEKLETGINIVPNPFIVNSMLDNNSHRYMMFTNLPSECTIYIVKGYYNLGDSEIKNINGAAYIQKNYLIKKLDMEKDIDIYSYNKWNLCDQQGNEVQSGFYRAYISCANFGDELEWIDFYFISSYDWVDVTGWLPNGWNEVFYDDESTIN